MNDERRKNLHFCLTKFAVTMTL